MKRIIFAVMLTVFLVGNCFALKLPAVPKERTVEIYGMITEEKTIQIVRELIEIDRTDGDIRIYLNSPGGYVTIGLPIAEVILTLRNDVQILAYGSVSSLAIPILAVGTKGKRAIFPRISMFFHKVFVEEPIPGFGYSVSQEEEWDYDDWLKRRKTAKLVRTTQIYIDDLLFEHTKITHEKLAEWDETWIYADTILKYELADGIYEGELRGE